MITRYETCIGLKLWKWNNFQIELWYCPKGYKIPKHSHDNQDIELTYLFGKATFNRQFIAGKIDTFKTSLKHFGKTFSIPAGCLHWFEVSNWPLVFLSREHWHCKPTSAALDFNKTIN